MRVIDNKLDIAKYIETPNHSGEINPSIIIQHYTGCSFDNAVKWLINPEAKASAHIVIGKDLRVIQLLEFNKKAWHAGKSHFGGMSGFNNFSIGIENENYGLLEKINGKYFTSGSDVTKFVTPKRIDGEYWDTFSIEHIKLIDEISIAICNAHGIKKMLRHSDIAPGRKIDPGPAFPWDVFDLKYNKKS